MNDQPASASGISIDPTLPALYRMKAVTRMTGLGRSTIYRLIAQQKFPAPVLLAARAVAWRRTDLERWSADRPATRH